MGVMGIMGVMGEMREMGVPQPHPSPVLGEGAEGGKGQ